jgi:NAD(P)H-quinone oxidoreductase subunit N
LGKKNIGQEAAVGQVYYVPPIATYELTTLPPKAKGLVLWILEGQILARQELEYLINLPKLEPKIKVAIEMGGERYFKWQPLADSLKAA